LTIREKIFSDEITNVWRGDMKDNYIIYIEGKLSRRD
jgi:hypothetical protein